MTPLLRKHITDYRLQLQLLVLLSSLRAVGGRFTMLPREALVGTPFCHTSPRGADNPQFPTYQTFYVFNGAQVQKASRVYRPWTDGTEDPQSPTHRGLCFGLTLRETPVGGRPWSSSRRRRHPVSPFRPRPPSVASFVTSFLYLLQIPVVGIALALRRADTPPAHGSHWYGPNASRD